MCILQTRNLTRAFIIKYECGVSFDQFEKKKHENNKRNINGNSSLKLFVSIFTVAVTVTITRSIKNFLLIYHSLIFTCILVASVSAFQSV